MSQAFCKVCKTTTNNTGTKLCDLCWGVDSRLNYLSDNAVNFFLQKLHARKEKRVKETQKMPLTTEQLHDIQTLLDNDNELTMWKTSKDAAGDLKGKYGCAFFNPKEEDPPQTSDDAEYGSTVQSAIERALRRWR